MEIRDVTYFLCIAEEGYLTRASQRLHVTQPTLSHFLSTLEGKLQTELFYRRNTGGLELTQAGQVYYEGAKEIEEIRKNTMRRIADISTGAGIPIRCGLSGSAQIARKLIEARAEFQKRYPDTLVNQFSAGTTELTKRVLSGALDFAYTAYQPINSRMTYRPVLTTEIDLVVPAEHPLAGNSYSIPGNENQRFSLPLVGGTQFALINEDSVMRKVEEEYFEKIGFHPEVNATYFYHSALKEYMQQGGYFGLSPRYQHYDGMARIALDPPMYYTFGIFYRSDAVLSASAKYLIELLCKMPLDYNL